MVFGVDDALIIAGIVASIAAAGAQGGATAAERRRIRIAEEEQAKIDAEQGRQVERQRQRERNLGTLGRQAEKRIAATAASREKSSRPTRGTLDPQQAPPTAMAPKPGVQPAPAVDVAGAAGTAMQPATAAKAQDVGGNIVKGFEVGAKVAEGVATGVQASQQQREATAANEELEKLREEEFQKALGNLKKDVNLQAMDFQRASSILPNRNARAFNQDLVSTLRNFSGRRVA